MTLAIESGRNALGYRRGFETEAPGDQLTELGQRLAEPVAAG